MFQLNLLFKKRENLINSGVKKLNDLKFVYKSGSKTLNLTNLIQKFEMIRYLALFVGVMGSVITAINSFPLEVTNAPLAKTTL